MRPAIRRRCASAWTPPCCTTNPSASSRRRPEHCAPRCWRVATPRRCRRPPTCVPCWTPAAVRPAASRRIWSSTACRWTSCSTSTSCRAAPAASNNCWNACWHRTPRRSGNDWWPPWRANWPRCAACAACWRASIRCWRARSPSAAPRPANTTSRARATNTATCCAVPPAAVRSSPAPPSSSSPSRPSACRPSGPGSGRARTMPPASSSSCCCTGRWPPSSRR